jgi:alpha-L-fucosidase 2
MVIALCALALPANAQEGNERSRLPGAELNLRLIAPITTWDEAIPLGNGILGGLLWGETNLIRLSLDRGDLWDERPAPGDPLSKFTYARIVQLVQEKKNAEISRIVDAQSYDQKHPTKIPAGRLEIVLDPSQQVKSFELNLASAEGRAWFTNGAKLDAFFCAAGFAPAPSPASRPYRSEPLALVRIPGPEPKALRLRPPASVKQLGYADPKTGTNGATQWFLQEAALGLRYCVAVGSRRTGDSTLLAITIVTSESSQDPVRSACDQVTKGLDDGYDGWLRTHVDYWTQFWSASRVWFPEPDILRHYYLVQYFYGAASRRGAPPLPLQGVWTADAGTLPPWKGDYHHDLNTQMTYLGYQAAGRFDEGACFLDFLRQRRSAFEQFAREFFGTPGLNVPGVMTLAGKPLGGWAQYSLSPVQAGWLAHLFYLHGRYRGERDPTLDVAAYPWCASVGESLAALLKPDAKGRLVLPTSSSPEIHDNSQRAWLKPNSNYDLAILKMLFLSLQEMATDLGPGDQAARWAQLAGKLGDFHTDADGTMRINEDEPLPGSHRHFSNLMNIYPFNLTTVEGTDRDREIIRASLKQYDRYGTMAWCGYSFTWMSALRARVGDAEAALRNLDIFVKAFILRNGFHVNGDQTQSGLSSFTYRPFTLEGNFLAAAAVHEMLLQSWSARPGSGDSGVIRLFPATPWRWHDTSFDDLRAEGGHRVSARRENNATTWFRVVAGRDGVVRIRDNFGGRAVKWDRPGIRGTGDNFEWAAKAGEVIEGVLPKPDQVSAAPADVAEPVVIRKSAVIRPNKLPLRIGADSNGGNRFAGELARVAVFNRPLSADEIRQLADRQHGDPSALKGAVAVVPFTGHGTPPLPTKQIGEVATVENVDDLPGKALRLEGKGFLEIAHDKSLDCLDGLTLAAWIRPHQLPADGMRLIDKSPVDVATAYLLDAHPGNSLRLITRDPHLIHPAKLPLNRWTHVAATVDAASGKRALYLDGRVVREEP